MLETPLALYGLQTVVALLLFFRKVSKTSYQTLMMHIMAREVQPERPKKFNLLCNLFFKDSLLSQVDIMEKYRNTMVIFYIAGIG